MGAHAVSQLEFETSPSPKPKPEYSASSPDGFRSTMQWRALVVHGIMGGRDAKGSGLVKDGSGTALLGAGANYFGQLGLSLANHQKTTATATKITVNSTEQVMEVECGAAFTCVVNDSGVLSTWGDGRSGQLGYGSEQVSGIQPVPKNADSFGGTRIGHVACGREHSLAIDVNGQLWSWGRNKFGQLGHGDHISSAVPRKLQPRGVLAYESIAAGDHHSAAVCQKKHMYTWGCGDYGQLGHGAGGAKAPPANAGGRRGRSKQGAAMGCKELRPKRVQGLGEKKCLSIVCGASTSAAVTTRNEVWIWGSTECFLRKGTGTQKTMLHFMPQLLEFALKVDGTAPEVVQVASGRSHIVVLMADGNVWAVGAGNRGQLGHGKRSDLSRPQMVLYGKDIMQVAAGRYHTCAVTSQGVLYTWGSGEHGQLLHGEAPVQQHLDEEGVSGSYDELVPRAVTSLLGRAVLRAACGEQHTLVLTTGLLHTHDEESAGTPSGGPDALLSDFEMWFSVEEEERQMKIAMAKKSTAGLRAQGKLRHPTRAHRSGAHAEHN